MVDPSGPGGSPSDYVVLAIANWVAQKGDAIDPRGHATGEAPCT